MEIVEPGPQATLQGAARTGLRGMGVPASGPADPLSHAIANHLVGNRPDAPALEITFGPFTARFGQNGRLALTGAEADAALNGCEIGFHETIAVKEGDELAIGRLATGLRTYLAMAGGFAADSYLGSTSTYLPAGFGGYSGRSLQQGDRLGQGGVTARAGHRVTPAELRLRIGHGFALRASAGPDAPSALGPVWLEPFRSTHRASRIGIELDGPFPDIDSQANLPSAAVFPGTLQMTPQGRGFLLLCDCQTTGGYPHILQVNRSDRHLLGQIRPGDTIRFLQRTPDQAAHDLRQKLKLIGEWMPGFRM